MNVVIIGLGHAGEKHRLAYQNIDGIKNLFSYDPKNTRANLQHDHQLKRQDLDVVSLCTPSHIRLGAIKEWRLAKNHLLIEKPLALTLEEANLIIDAFTNKTLGVVMQKRFNPDIQKLCGEVRAETFGKPLIASMIVRWYRPTSYYQGWKGETDKGGSILINQAIHHIDILQWILGPCVSVFSYSAAQGHKVGTTDSVVAVLKFQNGAIATLEASTVAYPKNSGERLTILSEWGRRTIDTAWPHHEPIIRNFVECVREKREPMVTGEESLKSLKIALALQESSDTGKEIIVV